MSEPNLYFILDDMIAEARFGPSGPKLFWLPASDHTGGDAEALLAAYGIRVWDRQLTNFPAYDKPYGLKVRVNQTAWADSLLRTRGFPMISPMYGEPFQKMPKPWGVPVPLTGMVGRILTTMGWCSPERASEAAERMPSLSDQEMALRGKGGRLTRVPGADRVNSRTRKGKSRHNRKRQSRHAARGA